MSSTDFSWLKLRLPDRIPACIPYRDYQPPNVHLTQYDWNKLFELIVVHPFWAIMQLFHLKLCEQRGQQMTREDKPILVKTSKLKEKPTTNDVKYYLNLPKVRDLLSVVPEFKANISNYGYWIEMIYFYQNTFMFICTFSKTPVPNVQYNWVGVGNGNGLWGKVWYMKTMTRLNGYKGIPYLRKERVGWPGLCPIITDHVKKLLMDHSQVS